MNTGGLDEAPFRHCTMRLRRVWLWLGARKQTGRGEGSSDLAFDILVNPPKQS